jgi:hypothetical protein
MLHRHDKNILFYKEIDQKARLFNGQSFCEISNNKLIDQLKKPYRYPDILVQYNGIDWSKDYNDYIDNIAAVKSITDGKINMNRTGTISNTALCLFNSMNIIQSITVKPYEFKYINFCGGGARIAEKYDGLVYKYDIRSFYPSLLASKILKIPVTAGTLTTISQIDIDSSSFVKYGIYNVKIDCKNNKLFTVVKSNMYTHYEVNRAKQLNYKITVIGQHLLWDTKDLVRATDLFGEYVEYLYKLKSKNKLFKTILNSLWGKLVASRTTYNIISTLENLKLNANQTVIEMKPFRNDLFTISIHDKNVNTFKTEYARLKPFLLGYGRVKLHQYVQKIGHKYVKFAHTDSIVSSIPAKKKLGKLTADMIGTFKFEGTVDCLIKNKSKIQIK